MLHESAAAPATISGSTAVRSLVYSSDALARFYQKDLDALLTHARAKNHAAGITGILLYRNHQFIQFLEGPSSAVDAIMAEITADPRHGRIRIAVDEFTFERQFSDWSMGYVPLIGQSSERIPGFRDSFADIAEAPEAIVRGRAAKELALWFNVRSAPTEVRERSAAPA